MQNSYRPNVAAVILSKNYPLEKEIFIAKRIDIKNIWQFPQGGIDDGETPQMALLRELKEEIGTNEIEIISEYPSWLKYDFPKNARVRLKPYIGQTQKYFLVRLKEDANINLSTKHPEFNEYKFIGVDEIFDCIGHFKKNIYKKVLDYFKKEGYI
ncbi:RNA pyrophosphohydrolase [Campylobacter sp. FMV-PI01]|uniref:RNA pyrophosphohydrolase n=1 Tax=Campylobacter portucalensis TaxID=2608384 RepID=A0A6L5WMS8_9BACT|nr:RNA pyrophosphohydrolase [Campylobacter portucalensis]MSN96981.1 RNA pyrophosphohydrolase [Campylobacter portucalensis]